MKARKLFAALGVGLILACCIMIYLMLDITLLSQNRDSKNVFKDVSLCHFIFLFLFIDIA